jgi:hypothetical protein
MFSFTPRPQTPGSVWALWRKERSILSLLVIEPRFLSRPARSQSLCRLLSRLLLEPTNAPIVYNEPVTLVENWASPLFHMGEVSGSNLGPRGICLRDVSSFIFPPPPRKIASKNTELRHDVFLPYPFRFTNIPTVRYCAATMQCYSGDPGFDSIRFSVRR